ncbi:hypothetical protein ABTH52_19815, partial [Acinetobacter baumannii]
HPLEIWTNGANRITVSTSGSVTINSTLSATGIYETSDLRLKNVLSRNKSADGIDIINYVFKPNNSIKIGVAAQDVKKVLPYAVQTNSEGIMQVDY